MPLGSTLATQNERAISHVAPARERVYAVGLTQRHREMIPLIARGLGDKEIAAQMGISPGTVKVYSSRIYALLGLTGRYQLAAWYVSRKLAGIIEKHGLGMPVDAVSELSELTAWLDCREKTATSERFLD